MTMGTSRIFRSTDSSAPVLAGKTPGSLKTLLKAVLVDGYGSNASLGWTTEFEAGNVIVFRMKGGTRKFIRIDDSGTISLWVADMSAFSSMSSISNGTERIPATGIFSYIYKQPDISGTNNIPWMVIGDDAGIWLLYRASYCYYPVGVQGLYWDAVYIGDYCPWDVRNKWNFCMHGNVGQNCFVPHTPNTNAFAERGSSFAKGNVQIGVLPFSNNTYFGHNYAVQPSFGMNKLGGSYLQSAVHLYETNATVSTILGNFPGVSEPIAQQMINVQYSYATNQPPYEELIDSDGVLSILLTMYHLQSYANTSDNTHRLIFKVGKGFRNVQ